LELRSYLRERLPDYMIPHAFVRLETLPLTPNGKVDRAALPVPEAADLASDARVAGVAPPGEGTAPRSPREAILAEIWRGVLGLPAVGIDDNFFALGGDSILAIQVVARAHDAGLRLSPTQLFQNQTIAELAEELQEGDEPSDAGGIALDPEARKTAPLTPIQR